MENLNELFGVWFIVATGTVNAVLLAIGRIPLDGTPLNQTGFWAWTGTLLALGLGALIGAFNPTPEGVADVLLNRILYGILIGGAAVSTHAALKTPLFRKLEGKPK